MSKKGSWISAGHIYDDFLVLQSFGAGGSPFHVALSQYSNIPPLSHPSGSMLESISYEHNPPIAPSSPAAVKNPAPHLFVVAFHKQKQSLVEQLTLACVSSASALLHGSLSHSDSS